MSDALTISEGRAAWQRIKDHTKASFDDWLTIGRALVVGKAQCLHQAGANRPYGPAYMRGMRAWLDSAGLGDIETQERRGAIFMAENETELVRWRSSLSAKEARHCNHPSTVVKHFQAGTRPQPRGPKTHNIVRPEHAAGDSSGYGKPIDWPRAEHIRRAAQAVGETYGSRDTFKIATAALKAALRHEDDVLALLQPAKSSPATKTTPAVAVELHA